MASQRRRSEPVFIRPGNNNHLVKIGGPTSDGRGEPCMVTSGYLDCRTGNVSLRLINSATSAGFNVTNDTKLVLHASAGVNGGLAKLPDDSFGFTSGLVISCSDDGNAAEAYLVLGVQRIR